MARPHAPHESGITVIRRGEEAAARVHVRRKVNMYSGKLRFCFFIPISDRFITIFFSSLVCGYLFTACEASVTLGAGCSSRLFVGVIKKPTNLPRFTLHYYY